MSTTRLGSSSVALITMSDSITPAEACYRYDYIEGPMTQGTPEGVQILSESL